MRRLFVGHVVLFRKNERSSEDMKSPLRAFKNVKMFLKGDHWPLYGAH